MPNDRLSIMGMIFHAHHGVEHDEIERGQRFEVDIEMKLDASRAAATDNLDNTVDIRNVYLDVQKLVVNQRFYLIETLCDQISQKVLKKYKIEEVTVRVRKPFAPLDGLANGTQIEMTRKRESS